MKNVYFLDINEFKKTFSYEEIYNKVSSYRKSKVDKLKFEDDKWLSLGAEFLLIQGLEELDIDYSKIEIGFVENNKPVLMNCPQNLYFNLSHSGKMAMCVISNCEVGCDIQMMSDKENYLEIAERFFHPEEIQFLQNSKEEEKRELFYRIWTLKESFIKATGKGFRTPLKDFRISLENDNPQVYINGKLEEKYQLEEKQVENSNYKSAVCWCQENSI